MKILNVKQGSPEWLAARLGKVTASEINTLVSPTGKVRTGQGPHTYLCRKVAEKVLGWTQEDAGSFAMGQGSIMEHEARPWFAFEYGLDVAAVGLCLTDDERYGCSPDGLIGADGGLEIKCPTPPVHMEYLLNGLFVPEDYLLQVQFSLWVTGRKWWNFLSYSRQLPPLVVHVTPDQKIQAAITTAISEFSVKFDMAVVEVTESRNKFFASKEAQSEANSR